MSLIFVDTEQLPAHTTTVAGDMRLSTTALWQPVPGARRRAAVQHARDVALAFLIGSAAAALLFIGLSGGFRP